MGNPSFSFLTFGTLALFSLSASATITFTNPTIANTGASNVVLPPATTTALPGASPGASPASTTQPTTATFYYSNIAANTETNPSGIAVYAGDGTTPCNTNLNPACHNPGDTFTLNVQSTAALSGSPQMYLLYCAMAPTATTQIAASGCTIIAQVPYTNGLAVPALTTTWAGMCAKIAASSTPITDMSATCTSASFIANTVPLYIMADVNGSFTISSEFLSFALYVDSVVPQFSSSASATLLGLYDFLAFPGDTQIIIQNPLVDSAFPTGENTVGIQFARFLYYADTSSGSNTFNATNFGNIPLVTTTFPTYAQVSVSTTGGVLSSGTISNLIDGTRYYLQAALVDFAGNIGYQTPAYAGGAGATDNTISHSAVPDQIVGLISQNGHCFVATAAFGSPMAEQVQTLRDFRDRFLMPHFYGRKFVSWYYRHSPEWAASIAYDDDLRKIVRTFLYPAIGFSWLALHWGAYNAALFSVTLLLLPFLLVSWRRSRFQMKARE